MRIGIIGAGSIGLLFAAYLSEVFTVTVYTRTEEQAKELRDNGIVLIKGNRREKKKAEAVQIEQWEGNEDLTLVTVKQYQLEPIIDKFSSFTGKILNVLFLQNGMGHLKLLSRLETHNIFVGSVEHGALKENTFTVSHNGEGATNLAVFRGDPEILRTFASNITPGFTVKWNDNYYEMLLHKLVVNAVINPLTAILQVKNGMLIRNEYYFSVLNNIFAEISDILNLDESNRYYQKVVEVCEKTAENRSSMLKDLQSGRKTEVDAILGFLLDEAHKQGKKPALIQAFYYLVKGKEAAPN